MTFDENRRLKSLQDYRILDTTPEESFDNIAQLTAKLFRVPITFIALIDETREWFKARFGLLPGELPRVHAFCDYTIRADAMLVVPDAAEDARFRNNPLVTGDPGIRFYCGVPLRTPDGQALGTLCLIDRVPRVMSSDQLELIELLGRQVEIELELRRRLSILAEAFEDRARDDRSQMLLVSMVVHDLRSPLTVITMLTTSIDAADADSRAALEDLLAEAERMRRMLTDILDICLHQVGGLKLRATAFRYEHMVEGVLRRMQRVARNRDQVLTFEVHGVDATEINGDVGLLERVLENLIGNAIQHAPANRSIKVVAQVVDGARLRVEVRDEGDAIPREYRESVFRLFERLDLAKDPRHHGRGLGLTFCRMVIDAHGGSIGVVPNGDCGNCFFFEIPVPSLT